MEDCIIDEVRPIFTGEELEVAVASKEDEADVIEKELTCASRRKRKIRNNKEGCEKVS